jgi:cellulose biosynthesis protein BcsQ
MRTIGIMSWKGGCGKTSTTINLAVALAEHLGKVVLVVDLDHTRATSLILLGGEREFKQTVGMALLGLAPITSLVCRTGFPNVDVVPAHPDLAVFDTKIRLATPARVKLKEESRTEETEVGTDGTSQKVVVKVLTRSLIDTALRQELALLPQGKYDYVLLDTPGGAQVGTRQAIVAADDVIVPFRGDAKLDTDQAEETIRDVVRASTRIGGHPRVLGIVPIAVKHQGVPPRILGQLDASLARYGYSLFTEIPDTSWLKSISGLPELRHRSVVTFRPRSGAALKFKMVAEELEYGVAAARARRAQAAIEDQEAGEPVPADSSGHDVDAASDGALAGGMGEDQTRPVGVSVAVGQGGEQP